VFPEYDAVLRFAFDASTHGVALWSHYGGGGDAIKFVRVGMLDDPDAFPPGVHVFTAVSLARRKAVLGR
jgi:hypothetical protein